MQRDNKSSAASTTRWHASKGSYMSVLRIVLAFAVATVLGWLGSMIALLPTQGVIGDEPIGQVLGCFALLIIANAVSSGLGFGLIRREPDGSRLWKHGVLAFAMGAGLAGLSVTFAFRSIAWPDMLPSLLLSPFVFPPLGGLIVVLRVLQRRPRRFLAETAR
jgi:hypothetical protein